MIKRQAQRNERRDKSGQRRYPPMYQDTDQDMVEQ